MSKKENKQSISEQIILTIFAVGGLFVFKTIAELYFGVTGILVWAISGAVGAGLGWITLKIFKAIKKK